MNATAYTAAVSELTEVKTEQEARIKFAHYFLDLQASLKREGAKADKHQEWENFIAHLVEEGDASPEAESWKCPRSLEAEIRNQQA